MRCPHCAGEVLDGSRFCGICGREIGAFPRPAPVAGPGAGSAVAPRPVAGPGPESLSAIERSRPPGARRARILGLLALDVVLAGVGLVMILSSARACERASSVPAASSDHPDPGASEARK